MRLTKILVLLNLVTWTVAAQTSQVNNYQDGNVLTGAELNAEFSNIYTTVNNLDNANLASNANIAPTKLSATIDGDGIDRQVDGSLDVNVDGTTVQIVADQLVIDDLPSSALLAESIGSAQITNGGIAKVDLAVKTTAVTATVGNVALSNDTGASILTFTAGSSGDLSNNLVNLTTNGGPVKIMIVPGTSTNVSYIECEEATTDFCELELARGGVTVTKIQFFSEGNKYRVVPGSFEWIDTPAAGTYEYKIRYNNPSADALRVLNVRLMAYEM